MLLHVGSLVAVSGATHCSGFSLRSIGSGARGLFSTCFSMWDLPSPKMKLMSNPALEGGFLTIAPSGKSHQNIFKGKVREGHPRGQFSD